MPDTHLFNQNAYKRKRLPWLALAMLPSLAIDGVLLWLWLDNTPYDPQVRGIFCVALVFLALVNLAAFKLGSIRLYFRVKRLQTRSRVIIGGGEVLHHRHTGSKTREQMADLLERMPPEDGKIEYVSAERFLIRRVERLRQTAVGDIIVYGDIAVERIDEPMEYFYGWDSPVRQAGSKRRHRIPPYFENMEGIWRELEGMRNH